MECMESWGEPMSSTGMPSLADRMGPTVLPHALSLRTITSWWRGGWRGGGEGGREEVEEEVSMMDEVTAVLAYRWLLLNLRTGP
ncbi:hypothetical protein CRUP_015221 [Coryphaenoides rupestris]|nr:hypothetical protein CRUP_015221 [Coryphaenoides rupestris]